MSVTCAHIDEDWELFALGSLEPAAQQSMSAHLQSGCAECQRKFLEAHAAVVSVGVTPPLLEPSPRVERALMKRIQEESRPMPARALPRWNFLPWGFAAACLLLASWLAWQQQTLRAQLAAARSSLESAAQIRSSLPAAPVGSEAQSPAQSSNTSPVPAEKTAAEKMATRDDAKKIAELETRIADLQRENAALGAVKAEADQQTAELRAQLTAEQSRADSLARDLQSAKAPAPNANSKPNPDSTNDAQVAALSAQLAASRAEVQRLQQLSVRNSQIEGLLESGALQQIELRGVDPGAGHAAARAIYSPTGGLLLVASSLPKLEHEKCYQLWLIRKGAPAILSAGLLETSTDGRGFLYAPPGNQLAQLTGLAITDEPKGGSVSARGHKLLFGAQ